MSRTTLVLARQMTSGLLALLGAGVVTATLGCDPKPGPSSISIASVSPASGPTTATTAVTIRGYGFKSGATVTFGGIAVLVSDVRDGTISVTAPIHASGSVDIVVTNLDGPSATKTNGFLFVEFPSISGVSPDVGSTSGGTGVTVTGSGFLTGATVLLDGAPVTSLFTNPAGTELFFHAGAHAAGTVDLGVRNLNGQTAIAVGHYTYAPPETFDFNGSWFAFLGNGNDFPFGFLIKDNALVSVTCDDGTVFTPPSPVPVGHGEFSAPGPTGVAFSGRIVAANAALGTIKVSTCVSANWIGSKDLSSSPARRR